MRRYFFRSRILLWTLALGIATSQFFNERENRVIDDEIRNATIIMPVDVQPGDRFALIGHACGDGFVEGWISSDGDSVGYGFRPMSYREHTDHLKRGKIINEEKIPTDRDVKCSKRCVVIFQNEKSGTPYFEIIWYERNGGEYFVTAESAQLANEFEHWIKEREKPLSESTTPE